MNLQDDLIERFVRYAKMDTQVNTAKAGIECPTNPKELELAALLAGELKELGLEVYSNNQGFVIGYLKGTKKELTPVAFMAHMDTAEGVPASNVQPQVHKNYNGEKIMLKEGTVIDPAVDPDLGKYKGDTIITADGTTLLGSDDKSGIAAIMTALKFLTANPDIEHGDIEAVFTPDEEGGDGMSSFPLEKLRSKIAYTLDGGEYGELEYECYNAYSVDVEFKGVAIHPGHARGRMVNALSMAAAYITLIPRSESPEATDGYYGCYWPNALEGNMDSAKLNVAVRDHSQKEVERRIEALKSFAQSVEAAFPGGKALLKVTENYRNMREGIEKNPEVMQRLLAAMQHIEAEPVIRPIRGGTDGSRLTAMGVPCPNIFTGGHNFHGREEWLSIGTLEKACRLVIEIAKGA
jgi:tripeptide aminopeptidase